MKRALIFIFSVFLFIQIKGQTASLYKTYDSLLSVYTKDTSNTYVLYEMSKSLCKMKKYSEGEKILKKKMNAIDYKADPEDYKLLGKIYYNTARWEEADTAFGMVLFIQPYNIKALYLKAVTADMLDPTIDENKKPRLIEGKAIPYFEKLLVYTEQDWYNYKQERIDAYHYLAYYNLVYKDYCKSIFYWQKIIEIEPENRIANEAMKDLTDKCR